MSRDSWIRLAVLIVLLGLIGLWRFRYPGKAPAKLTAESCNSDLWKHVYEKDRLKVVEACTAVDGRVVSIHRNSDGDMHIALAPDRKSVLNLINVFHAHGELVAEVICEHPPADAVEKAACADFQSQVAIPNVGDRVRVTGAYVTDRDNGWREIHPVARIEKLN